ncbi:hypothetical protein [Metabacillus halosaccharovorans]|uniref:Uncharacterized protein n=1 Tax=Metabacillus halosaccharovorans TaxID=930124 RepID=A0ABT3DLS0_9BACI|nr:hypothetical protein [Metabacillus halosaccharovorans]MCV9888014.1 hypothetical protein [Metabacillus halosaccharovorans]
MRKKMLALLVVIVGFVAVSTYIIYRLIVPQDFYTKEELLEKIPISTSEKEIQDIVQLDEETYFVPFLSEDGSYGSSIWVWRIGKWECVGADSASGPQIVTNNGSSYVYWNVHPQDEVQKWDIYLTSERNYSVTNGNRAEQLEVYFPKIQVKHSIEVGKEHYGYVEMPSQWKEVIGSFDLNPAETGLFPSSHSFLFHWQASNGNQEPINLEHTFRNGGGGTYTGDYIQHMQQLNSEELE